MSAGGRGQESVAPRHVAARRYNGGSHPDSAWTPCVTLLADSVFDASTIMALVAIPLLIAVNGFFVASEFALVAVRRTRVEELVNGGDPRAKSLLDAVDHLDRSVAASQLGITLTSLALGLVSEPALHAILSPLFSWIPDGYQGWVTRTLSVAATLAVVTYLHVVFGEQMPKIAALQSPERVGLLVGGITNRFARLAHPVIRLMNVSSNIGLKLFGFRSTGHAGEIHSVEELQMIIEDTEEAGLLDSESADYLYNVFELSNKKVRDIMVAWDKVMALEITTPSERVLQAVRDGAHTRMPVYQGNPDNIVGVVNSKDLFYLFSLRGLVNLEDARYDPQFLDAEGSVANALRLFRRSKNAMAVVRDGGKVVGILTLEDVLEEIIGDIEDEHDDPVRRRQLQAKARRTTTHTPRLPPKTDG